MIQFSLVALARIRDARGVRLQPSALLSLLPSVLLCK